ncbi:MAG: hypothetical protein A2W98_03940 [Bacteroidetes bacterium GWF2_33_38]|nr:MAG: hypothetical protein A2W98_03940 [Bacteroidetes bacterium GWF2_33_38]OFY76206.1 MAG: hypothetical protein A2265_10765 [Bacteroidetes bacterium RIFOXYA12_FULL_33_9]OFY92111.1 MAG: hypothetical protein A2236_07635 [Bacteroidetes bacterium RIFOXYA2_FULL_33_7]
MKTLKLITIGILFFIVSTLQAQVSVNVNIGTPPAWGPAGYPSVRYYYLPDVEAYYDVQTSMFIYFSKGTWIHRTHLPSYYNNYDLYGGYKVVMPDYHGNSPYSFYNEHRMKYKKGYCGNVQKTNGQKPGNGNRMNNGNKLNNDKPAVHGNSNNEHGNGGGKKK